MIGHDPTLQTPGVALAWAALAATTPRHAPPKAPAPTKFADVRGAVLRPLPKLPLADSVPLDAESHMRLAVALDVVCSVTRKITPGPTVLAQTTQAWLRLHGRKQSRAMLEGLIALAHDPTAAARARVSRGLTRAASGKKPIAAAAHSDDHPVGPLTTPQSVAVANRHVEAAGEAIVYEMVLWLSSQERTEFRRG